MALQSFGARTSNATTGQPCFGIYTPRTVRAALLELSVITGPTVAANGIGIGRPDVIGVPSLLTPFVPDDPTDPVCIVNGVTTWSIFPSQPTVFSRRWNTANLAGLGFVWSFPRGYIIGGAALSAMVVWNTIGNGTFDINAIVDA